jgi:diphosphomevalonate decarboxylase
MERVKVKAPSNIAIIKYWGKLDKKYNIPTKSSLSITVKDLYTITELEVEEGNMDIQFYLNGELKDDAKINRFFNLMSELIPEIKNYNYYINTKNNFPTAAGFASSASGFAALVFALAEIFKKLNEDLYKDKFSDEIKLSSYARIGSGSSSRSIPSKGGYVLWKRPSKVEFLMDPIYSSYSFSIFPPNHWTELKIIYVMLETKEKKVKSTKGMISTTETNPLLFEWSEYEENVLLPELIESIENKDFGKFAEITMRASDGLHSMMMMTYPRIVYLNDKSHEIIDWVIETNKDETKVAYTFDAGPSPVLFTLEKYLPEIEDYLKENGLRYIITSPGKGPEVLK